MSAPTLDELAQVARRPEPVNDWYRIEAAATGERTRARIYIYDAIGGWWGISSAQFVTQVADLDVDEIEVHLNSPGGSVWDGIAIMNVLKTHAADVTVYVDGLAASAASLVALGGDTIVMAQGSQLMIHEASTGTWGTSTDLTKAAEILDKIGASMAELYATKAGGTAAEWRELMRAETWYTAREAVEAGLADSVVATQEESVAASVAATATFDLSMYRGRPHQTATAGPQVVAIATPVPAGRAGGTKNQQKGVTMSDAFLAGVRERLGIKADAELSESEVLTALEEVLGEQAEPTTPTAKIPDGTVMVDAEVWQQVQADAAKGREAHATQVADRRAGIVQDAVASGRIPESRADHYRSLLEKDEDGTAQFLAQLQPNTIPVKAVGYSGGVDEASTEDDQLYSKIAEAAFGEKVEG